MSGMGRLVTVGIVFLSTGACALQPGFGVGQGTSNSCPTPPTVEAPASYPPALDPVWNTYASAGESFAISLPSAWDGVFERTQNTQRDLEDLRQRDQSAAATIRGHLPNADKTERFYALYPSPGAQLAVELLQRSTSVSLQCELAGFKQRALADRQHVGAAPMIQQATIGRAKVGVASYMLHSGTDLKVWQFAWVTPAPKRTEVTLLTFMATASDTDRSDLYWRIAEGFQPRAVPLADAASRNPVHSCLYMSAEAPRISRGTVPGSDCDLVVGPPVAEFNCVTGIQLPAGGVVTKPLARGASPSAQPATLARSSNACRGGIADGQAYEIAFPDRVQDAVEIVDINDDAWAGAVIMILRSAGGASVSAIVDPGDGLDSRNVLVAEGTGGNQKVLARWPASYMDWSRGVHRLTVQIQGQTVTVWLDGRMAVKTQTSVTSSGTAQVLLVGSGTADSPDAPDLYRIMVYGLGTH